MCLCFLVGDTDWWDQQPNMSELNHWEETTPAQQQARDTRMINSGFISLFSLLSHLLLVNGMVTLFGELAYNQLFLIVLSLVLHLITMWRSHSVFSFPNLSLSIYRLSSMVAHTSPCTFFLCWCNFSKNDYCSAFISSQHTYRTNIELSNFCFQSQHRDLAADTK